MRTCVFLDLRRRECCTECGQQVTLCKCEDPETSAWKRMNSDEGKFISHLWAYLENNQSMPSHLFEDLAKNLGELGQALVQHNANRTPDAAHIFQILVRLAGTATILAADGTPEYAYPSG